MVKADNVIGLMVFHMASAISMIEIAIDRGEIQEAVTALNDVKQTSGTVLERALWETYSDFLNPQLNPDLPQNVVPLIQ
jgi:hypothetical protein|tara:strand:- start:424 stop:660 length:237 start_codon:yes stop_codon:yes gene_type:complete